MGKPKVMPSASHETKEPPAIHSAIADLKSRIESEGLTRSQVKDELAKFQSLPRAELNKVVKDLGYASTPANNADAIQKIADRLTAASTAAGRLQSDNIATAGGKPTAQPDAPDPSKPWLSYKPAKAKDNATASAVPKAQGKDAEVLAKQLTDAIGDIRKRVESASPPSRAEVMTELQTYERLPNAALHRILSDLGYRSKPTDSKGAIKMIVDRLLAGHIAGERAKV